jgi:hypothetical protein
VGDIRPFVPKCRSSIAALVAVVALLVAAPFERRRDCNVCPVDCPMHARQGAQRVGCHHGDETAPAARAVDTRPGGDGACAMRASCGNHGGTLPAFHGELRAPSLVVAIVEQRLAPLPDRPVLAADDPAPPERPPEPSVV